jgi:hypothetical protein
MSKFFLPVFIILAGLVTAEAQPGFTDVSNQAVRRLSILQRYIEPLYRKPSKEELKIIAPKPELVKKFGEFLLQPNTGLTKLINDTGCAENTKIVVATNDCLKYTMPGAGNSYSFRVKNYRIPRLADLVFTDNSFQAAGVLVHGIIVNVGDVPLDKIGLQSDGVSFLAAFQPEVNYDNARTIDRKLIAGIRQNGFLYRRGLYAAENTTFVLRSIAYDGKYFRAINGVTYDEFEFDNRKDVIVAFRIVERDSKGNVTIIWKELQKKDAPVIKIKIKETKKEE